MPVAVVRRIVVDGMTYSLSSYSSLIEECYVYAVDVNVAFFYYWPMSLRQIKSENSLAMRFGDRVRQVRLQKGIPSQEALADLAGLHRTFIGRVERGETNITLENIKRIAMALNVSLAELFASFQEVEHGSTHT